MTAGVGAEEEVAAGRRRARRSSAMVCEEGKMEGQKETLE
jgi:hypothetical protein